MTVKEEKKYRYRFLARIIIELKTPLSIGSGEESIITDRQIVRDVHGLPYIPGTALAGITRHSIDEEKANSFFGEEGKAVEKNNKKEYMGQGSQIIFSSAHIVWNKEGKVIERFEDIDPDMNLDFFRELPVRQHVQINSRGVAEKSAKFDEEVVPKGTRFCFEIEMLSEKKENISFFESVLSELSRDTLRMGSGTRNGFGEIAIGHRQEALLDLSNPKDLKDYLDKTSSLNSSFWRNKPDTTSTPNAAGWDIYELILYPDDFFLFSSGFGDDDADITPVTEAYINWDKGKPEYRFKQILIPGTSVKGALSHRVAFYFNKKKELFTANPESKTGSQNEAVRTLFGYAADDGMKRGNVLVSDVIDTNEHIVKMLNHVAIDRFTGGSIDGALFNEKVVYGGQHNYRLKFYVNPESLKDKAIKFAWEESLKDVVKGMLPLGGGTNRGHGCFSGIVEKNGKEIFKNISDE